MAAIKRSKQPVQLNSTFLSYVRVGTFDPDQFKRGHAEIYSNVDMTKFGNVFNKQLQFNFSQRKASAKRTDEADCRPSRSAIEDLDHNISSFNVSTNDFQELSRYIMEDMIKAYCGNTFLICIAKDFDTSGVHQQIAAQQRNDSVGGGEGSHFRP